MKQHFTPSSALCRSAEKKIRHRTAVPLAVLALCCGSGIGGGMDALAAVCGPGRTLPANTWLMTAPSCSPSPVGVSDQYATDFGGTYGTDWISFVWDPAAQSYSEQLGTDSLALGIGNWNYSYNAGTLFLDGTPTTTASCSDYGDTDLVGNCFVIDLTPSASDIWQIIGHPFPYTVDWRNVRIASSSDGTSWTQRTPSQAAEAGVDLMAKEFWRWNGSSYQTKDDVSPGSIGALKPQESVWVRIKSGSGALSVGDFKLLIPMRELNDTGITWSGNYQSGNNKITGCVSYTDPTFGDNVAAAQDCSHGPDVTGDDDADGLGGFSYTKLDSSGQPLPDQTVEYTTTPWACVQDNVTGLIWEVKTDDGLLHDKDDTYTWYNTDPATNGGMNGEENPTGTTCYDYTSGDTATYCNTQAYVERVNTAGWCGASDWRMPTVKELESLANYGRANMALDFNYFPNPSNYSWSMVPYADDSSGYAWFVRLSDGFSNVHNQSDSNAVRLVRAGQ